MNNVHPIFKPILDNITGGFRDGPAASRRKRILEINRRLQDAIERCDHEVTRDLIAERELLKASYGDAELGLATEEIIHQFEREAQRATPQSETRISDVCGHEDDRFAQQ